MVIYKQTKSFSCIAKAHLQRLHIVIKAIEEHSDEPALLVSWR